MTQFLQQNWVWVILIGAMLAMHLGGHRHGGQPGHGARHAGCGGHAAHRTSGREEQQDHGPATTEQTDPDPSRTATRSHSARDAS